MNKKFHIYTFRGLLAFLLVLALNACAAQPEEVVPVARPTVTIEPTLIPSPIPPSPTPDSTDAKAVDVPTYLALATKPDVPPQTINGVTVTIDLAYADESRVFVKYTISGLDWPDHVWMDPTLWASLSSTAIQNINEGAASGGAGSVMDGMMTGSIDQMLTADAIDAAQTPIVDLQVDIPVDGTGAELSVPPSSGQSPKRVPMELPNIGTFHFEFEVPVFQGIKLMDLDKTVEANGISITLKSLILNRSHVDAFLCYEMPSERDWAPHMIWGHSGGPTIDDMGGFGSSLLPGDGKPFALTDPQRCVGVGSELAYDGGPTILTITIPKLLTSVPDGWALTEEHMKNANQKLADKGIVIAYNNDPHNPFVVVQRPDGATDGDIYPLIWDALADWYEGPWEFTVEVNP